MSWESILKDEDDDDAPYSRFRYSGHVNYPYTKKQEHKIKLIKIAKDHLDKFDEKEKKYIESYIRKIKVLGLNRDENWNNRELVKKLEKRLKRKGLMVHYSDARIETKIAEYS